MRGALPDELARRASRADRRRRRVLREPLLLFLGLGLFLFVAEQAVRRAKETRRVELPAAEVMRLVQAFEAQAGRPPDEGEHEMLVAERVREEVLYREALRLGLDEGDVIVRRRLAQKMGFVLADRLEVEEPTAEEAERFFDEHAERYVEPARVAFRHLFWSVQGRGVTAAEEEARAALVALHSKPSAEGDAWRRLGEAFMLGREYGDRTLTEIAELFGRGFAEHLAGAPIDRWSGPVVSPYGVHLVRVTARTAATQPELDEVRERVIEDLREARRRRADEAAFQELLRRYRVTVAAAPPLPSDEAVEPGPARMASTAGPD